MAAAPQLGTFTARGIRSGRVYSTDVYFSDVANANARFDSGSGAGAATDTFYTFPEDVQITDFSVVTGLTDTTKIRLTVSGRPLQNILRYALHLTTLNNRPFVGVGIGAGSRFSAVQLA